MGASTRERDVKRDMKRAQRRVMRSSAFGDLPQLLNKILKCKCEIMSYDCHTGEIEFNPLADFTCDYVRSYSYSDYYFINIDTLLIIREYGDRSMRKDGETIRYRSSVIAIINFILLLIIASGVWLIVFGIPTL